jgi:two-component system cell cycle response regulator DivK
MARILVIEDAPADMELMSKVLEKAGHIALTAPTAESGLSLAKALVPDLILMDTQLPGMDGLTAARRLKDHEHTRSIPVIALALPAKGAEERILASGCEGHILKPLQPETLWEQIKAALIKQRIE